MKRGSLCVAGMGIQAYTQITDAARHAIRDAEIVFYLAGDPLITQMVTELNNNTVTLDDLYGETIHRLVTYKRMADRIMGAVREGARVCAAFYGHAGVFAMTPHVVVRMARDEGFDAMMLPGISAEDCLIADLGMDPGRDGCLSFEATAFLSQKRKPDTRAALLLWQIGLIGEARFPVNVRRKNLGVLAEVLSKHYGEKHVVTVYEAASLPGFKPICQPVTIDRLARARMSAASTLYVPALKRARTDPKMAERLGLKKKDDLTCLR